MLPGKDPVTEWTKPTSKQLAGTVLMAMRRSAAGQPSGRRITQVFRSVRGRARGSMTAKTQRWPGRLLQMIDLVKGKGGVCDTRSAAKKASCSASFGTGKKPERSIQNGWSVSDLRLSVRMQSPHLETHRKALRMKPPEDCRRGVLFYRYRIVQPVLPARGLCRRPQFMLWRSEVSTSASVQQTERRCCRQMRKRHKSSDKRFRAWWWNGNVPGQRILTAKIRLRSGHREGWQAGAAPSVRLARRWLSQYEPRCEVCPSGVSLAIRERVRHD